MIQCYLFLYFQDSHPLEVKKVGDSCDKELTLFPIVTSLVPSKEKSCRSARKSEI